MTPAPAAAIPLAPPIYAVADARTVAAILDRHPDLAPLLDDVALACAQYFPDAPLRLHVDGDGLAVGIGVADVEAELTDSDSALLRFDRYWWHLALWRAAGRLIIDVEAL